MTIFGVAVAAIAAVVPVSASTIPDGPYVVALPALAGESSGLGQRAAAGRIEGTLTTADGAPAAGVTVVVEETGQRVFSGSDGGFLLDGMATATYSITFIQGVMVESIQGLAVRSGATTRIDHVLDWSSGAGFYETAEAVSRHPERIVDAPAAVSVVGPDEIAMVSAPGRLPELLEFKPGVELTQISQFDFNLNTRGFNSTLTRRVATLIDGRDPAAPFFGSQEWGAFSAPLDDIARLEFVRGPNGALYGANASSGVIDIQTRSPRSSVGGMFRLAGGQQASVNFDFRWAGELGQGWYVKVVGGGRRSDGFSVSRNAGVEYSVPCSPGTTADCLPEEATPLPRDDGRALFGGLRFDKYLDRGRAMIFEAGYADIAGAVVMTAISRWQVLDSKRPWARANYSSDRFSLSAYYNGRRAPRQVNLGSAANTALASDNLQLEAQGNWTIGELFVAAGSSFRTDWNDSFDPAQGSQTLMYEPVTSRRVAVYGQLEYDGSEKLRLILAGRVDDSDIHEVEFSPKAALVYRLGAEHSVRATYNEAFQAPAIGEIYVQVEPAPPADLSHYNALCEPLDCGLGLTPRLAVGNRNLVPEHIRTFEVGYSGVLGRNTRVTADYYQSRNADFITDLLPQLETPLGRINPDYGPWQAPVGVPDSVAEVIRQQEPFLTNHPDGSNGLVLGSFANFGEVHTQGIDLSANHTLGRWGIFASYSWFDFDIEDSEPELAHLLLPNSPAHKASAGFSYVDERWSAGVSARWVDEFRWSTGVFQGNVESFTTVDLNGSYDLRSRWRLGINVANLFEDLHYEAFGGDLLGRRLLAYATVLW